MRDLEAGDIEGWYERLCTLALSLEKLAEHVATDGHLVSARQKWLRASNYYRAAGSFHTIFDAPGEEALQGRRR